MLRGMTALLEAGAVRALKVEVFDALLRLQGCSASMLVTLLLTAGFELRALKEPTGASGSNMLPTEAPLLESASALASLAQPCNLWGVLRRGASPPPSPSTPEAAGAASVQDRTPGSEWSGRVRRRSSHRFRTARARRLADVPHGSSERA